MIDRDARRLGILAARRSSSGCGPDVHHQRPPAPVMTMLGEIVVHTGTSSTPRAGAGDEPGGRHRLLDMYKTTGFPVGTKKRIDGLRLVATDADWSHGDGAEVTGPRLPLLLAMTGRTAAVDALSGAGVATLRSRMPAAR